MIDLNKIGGGKKLITHIVKNVNDKNTPWSRKQQIKKIKAQKNIKSSPGKP